MYLRRTQRRTKDGGAVGYLQLAHNVWDRESRQSRVRAIHSFGREDELDRMAIVRLIGSLERVLEPGEALEARADAELRFVESRAMGGALMLDGLWRRLGIDTVMAGLLEGRRLDAGAERVLFALVANRALEPLSKLAATGWVRERAWIDGLDDVTDDACYRAMDWLLEIEEQLCERVYWQTADLLNLEVDLLFFDTTSTYFETDRADEPQVDEDGVATPAFRSYCVLQTTSELGDLVADVTLEIANTCPRNEVLDVRCFAVGVRNAMHARHHDRDDDLDHHSIRQLRILEDKQLPQALAHQRLSVESSSLQ